jgi:GNAT superfamily N-acetyltransferase
MESELSSLVVRVGEPADVAAVSSLFSTSWAATAADADGVLSEGDRLWLDRHLLPFWSERLAGCADWRVAVIDGVLAGFTLVDPLTGLLDKLYVLPEFWASGAAVALHDAALTMLRDAGCVSAQLTCRASNGRAARFYERHGWVRREYLDWDGYRWTRAL